MKKKSPVLTNRFLLFILIISFGHNLKLTLSLFLNCLGFFCFSELFYSTNFDFQARFIYRISLYFCNEWFFSLCFSSVWLVCVNGNCFFFTFKKQKKCCRMLLNCIKIDVCAIVRPHRINTKKNALMERVIRSNEQFDTVCMECLLTNNEILFWIHLMIILHTL